MLAFLVRVVKPKKQSIINSNNISNAFASKSESAPTFNFDPSIIVIDKNKGLVNLTKMAKHFGKEIPKWKERKSTKNFLNAFFAKNPPSDNWMTALGGNNEQGTWACRKIALKLAEWLSPEFEVWANEQLDTLFQTGTVSLQQTPKILTMEDLLEMNTKAITSLRAKVEEQSKQLESQAPVVSFVEETFAQGNTGLSTMKTVASEVKMQPVAFYKMLRENKIYYYQLNEFGKNENMVMAKYIASGHFVVKQNYSTNQQRSFDKIYATPKGKLLCFKLAQRENKSLPSSNSQTLQLESDDSSDGAEFIAMLEQDNTPVAKALLEAIYETMAQTGATIKDVVESIRYGVQRALI